MTQNIDNQKKLKSNLASKHYESFKNISYLYIRRCNYLRWPIGHNSQKLVDEKTASH